MKKLFLILVLFVLSCSDVEKPKNLIPEKQMSEILADFAIYEQSFSVNPNANMETTSRYVLKKHKVKASDFNSSYEYYVKKIDALDKILDNAQEIILEKDPKSAEYIEKKLKENPQIPAFAR